MLINVPVSISVTRADTGEEINCRVIIPYDFRTISSEPVLKLKSPDAALETIWYDDGNFYGTRAGVNIINSDMKLGFYKDKNWNTDTGRPVVEYGNFPFKADWEKECADEVEYFNTLVYHTEAECFLKKVHNPLIISKDGGVDILIGVDMPDNIIAMKKKIKAMMDAENMKNHGVPYQMETEYFSLDDPEVDALMDKFEIFNRDVLLSVPFEPYSHRM